jgi:hypothetical protein
MKRCALLTLALATSLGAQAPSAQGRISSPAPGAGRTRLGKANSNSKVARVVPIDTVVLRRVDTVTLLRVDTVVRDDSGPRRSSEHSTR